MLNKIRGLKRPLRNVIYRIVCSCERQLVYKASSSDIVTEKKPQNTLQEDASDSLRTLETEIPRSKQIKHIHLIFVILYYTETFCKVSPELKKKAHWADFHTLLYK